MNEDKKSKEITTLIAEKEAEINTIKSMKNKLIENSTNTIIVRCLLCGSIIIFDKREPKKCEYCNCELDRSKYEIIKEGI